MKSRFKNEAIAVITCQHANKIMQVAHKYARKRTRPMRPFMEKITGVAVTTAEEFSGDFVWDGVDNSLNCDPVPSA